MSQWNLEYYRQVYNREISSAAGGASLPGLPFSDFLPNINAAYGWIADRLRVDKTESIPGSLVASQSAYSLPVDRLGWAIDKIEVKSQDGQGWIALERTTRARAEAIYNIVTPQAGPPVLWTHSLTDPTKIELFPPPNYGIASGIRFVYNRMARLHRICDQTGVAATFTYGSTAVTLSGTIAPEAILAGDAIGMKRTLQSDGVTADSGQTPWNWYSVLSRVGVDIVLYAAFDETGGGSGKPFVSAQVHPIERLIPEKLQLAPVYHALGLHFARQSGELSRYYQGEARMIVDPMAPTEPNVALAPPNYASLPWMRRHGGTAFVDPNPQ